MEHAIEIEQIALLAGILFILIAVVGGGFAIKEIRIPKVPGWARVASLIIGVGFVATSYFGRPMEPQPEQRETSGFALIHVDEGPARSRHGLKLTRLTAETRDESPRVGQALTIAFTLRNTGNRPITFSEIFVAARGPSADNRDFGWSHQDLTLAPDESIDFKTSMIAEIAGVWTFWPCYVVADGSNDEDAFCPERWRAFPVRVVD